MNEGVVHEGGCDDEGVVDEGGCGDEGVEGVVDEGGCGARRRVWCMKEGVVKTNNQKVFIYITNRVLRLQLPP